MLGGIDNSLFFQGFGGFLGVLILIPILKWTFDSPSMKAERIKRRADKKSLRKLKRK